MIAAPDFRVTLFTYSTSIHCDRRSTVLPDSLILAIYVYYYFSSKKWYVIASVSSNGGTAISSLYGKLYDNIRLTRYND